VSPLVAYAIAEITVAAWACLIPFLLSLLETTDAIKLLSNDSWGVQTTARATFCFVLLLPATIALGATLPFMAELFSPAAKPAAGRVAQAYALNTVGAVVGVIGATFFLLVVLGVRASSIFAAGLSVVCALIALSLAWF
jgi:spermidine synthase